MHEVLLMEFLVKAGFISKSLGYAQSIVEKRFIEAILGHVKIESLDGKLVLTATDREINIVSYVDAEILKSGAITVPAHMLYEIVRKIPEDTKLHISLNTKNSSNQHVMLKSSSTECTLPYLPPEEFPHFEDVTYACSFNIEPDKLNLLLGNTRYATSLEETRYYLRGVYLHSIEENGIQYLRAVATDIHRLAKADILSPVDAQKIPGMLIPRKTVYEVVKLLEDYKDNVKIGASQNKISFTIGNHTIISKLIDGKFPDYTKGIPDDYTKCIEISTSEFISAINLVTSISYDKTKTIRIDLSNNLMIISAKSQLNGHTSAKQEVAVEYQDDPIAIAFNARYLLDALSNVKSNKACMLLGSKTGSATFYDTDNDMVRHVIMPIQI